MSYTELKKRRLEQLKQHHDHVPKPADIVKLLLGEENITEHPHPIEDNVTVCSAPCPKEGHVNCLVKWRKGSGFSNPLSKMRGCFGGQAALLDAYWAVYDSKRRGESPANIRSALNWAAGFDAETNAAFDWLRMIVMKNWPVTCVEDTDYRAVFKHTHRFSYKRICMVLFLLGEIVEEKITEQLKNAHAVCMYDGVTRSGTHYVAVYVSYILNEGKGKDGGERVEINLLACSPMPATPEEEELIESDDPEEDPHFAAKFDAETMRNHIQNVLSVYGHTIASLLVAFLADNTAVNLKMAKDANLPHLPCMNHTVALDVSKSFDVLCIYVYH